MQFLCFSAQLTAASTSSGYWKDCPIHIIPNIKNFGVTDGAILWPPGPDFHLHPNIRDTVSHFRLARDTAANTCDKNRCYIDLCSMVRPLTSTICTLFFFLAFFCIRKSMRTSVLPFCETTCKDGKAILAKQKWQKTICKDGKAILENQKCQSLSHCTNITAQFVNTEILHLIHATHTKLELTALL